MSDQSEIIQLLRSIDDKLGQMLDPLCKCGHRASQHTEGTLSGLNGCCVASVCDCGVFRRTVEQP